MTGKFKQRIKKFKYNQPNTEKDMEEIYLEGMMDALSLVLKEKSSVVSNRVLISVVHEDKIKEILSSVSRSKKEKIDV